MTSPRSEAVVLVDDAPNPMPYSQRSKEFADVLAFHKKFELLNFPGPGHLSEAKLRERIEFLREELEEFEDAAATQDLAQQADALVDLVYVALGTAVMLGLPWDPLWDDVQRANMSKVRGVTKRGHAVDVTKPEGWVGPQTEKILEANGYDPKHWFASCGLVDHFMDDKGRDDVQRN